MRRFRTYAEREKALNDPLERQRMMHEYELKMARQREHEYLRFVEAYSALVDAARLRQLADPVARKGAYFRIEAAELVNSTETKQRIIDAFNLFYGDENGDVLPLDDVQDWPAYPNILGYMPPLEDLPPELSEAESILQVPRDRAV